jgi:hypothetical protein
VEGQEFGAAAAHQRLAVDGPAAERPGVPVPQVVARLEHEVTLVLHREGQVRVGRTQPLDGHGEDGRLDQPRPYDRLAVQVVDDGSVGADGDALMADGRRYVAHPAGRTSGDEHQHPSGAFDAGEGRDRARGDRTVRTDDGPVEVGGNEPRRHEIRHIASQCARNLISTDLRGRTALP